MIVAESSVYDAEDSLKQNLFAESKDTWNLRVLPTDRPTADFMPVDVEAAIRTAFEKRTDIVAARKSLERADISVRTDPQPTLPQLDLVASYGGSGVGGTQLRDANGDPLVPPIPGGYGDATSQVFGFDFPTWRVGFNISYPILNRQAKASAAQARISKEQALASFRRLQLNAAVEIRTAGRAVETNFKRVASSKAARVLAAERLDAEQKKFEAGMSTNFFVTQAQRDLTVAEVGRAARHPRLPDQPDAPTSGRRKRGSGEAGRSRRSRPTPRAAPCPRAPSLATRAAARPSRTALSSVTSQGGHVGPPLSSPSHPLTARPSTSRPPIGLKS